MALYLWIRQIDILYRVELLSVSWPSLSLPLVWLEIARSLCADSFVVSYNVCNLTCRFSYRPFPLPFLKSNPPAPVKIVSGQQI